MYTLATTPTAGEQQSKKKTEKQNLHLYGHFAVSQDLSALAGGRIVV